MSDSPPTTEREQRLEDALRELVDAAENVRVYPEGAFGFEDLNEAIEKAKKELGDA